MYIYAYFGTWLPASSQERATLHRFGVSTLHHEHSMSSIKDGMENSAKWSDCFKELIVAWLHASSVQLWPVCGLVASLRRTKITRTRSNCCRRRSAVEPNFWILTISSWKCRAVHETQNGGLISRRAWINALEIGRKKHLLLQTWGNIWYFNDSCSENCSGIQREAPVYEAAGRSEHDLQ